MKKTLIILAIILGCSGFARGASQYELVKLITLENKDFKNTNTKGDVFTDIGYPECKSDGKAEIDIGDYYLGPDCFSGDIRYVKVIKLDNVWRIQIPYCYSSHVYQFVRTIKVFCKYPQKV